jgi:excisionase family DNA binding protein
MPESTQLLTVSEFADRIRIKPSCVRRWILERKLTIVRVGRLVRIPVGEVDRIIAAGTRPARGARQ